jgi:hypothetical protein
MTNLFEQALSKKQTEVRERLSNHINFCQQLVRQLGEVYLIRTETLYDKNEVQIKVHTHKTNYNMRGGHYYDCTVKFESTPQGILFSTDKDIHYSWLLNPTDLAKFKKLEEKTNKMMEKARAACVSPTGLEYARQTAELNRVYEITRKMLSDFRHKAWAKLEKKYGLKGIPSQPECSEYRIKFLLTEDSKDLAERVRLISRCMESQKYSLKLNNYEVG